MPITDAALNEINRVLVEQTNKVHNVINEDLATGGHNLQGYYDTIYNIKNMLMKSKDELNDELIMIDDNDVETADDIESRIGKIVHFIETTDFLLTKYKNAAGSIGIPITSPDDDDDDEIGGRRRKEKKSRTCKKRYKKHKKCKYRKSRKSIKGRKGRKSRKSRK